MGNDMSIEDKLAKAAELEALAAKLRAEVESERVKKWEPKGGCVGVFATGEVGDISVKHFDRLDFGTLRATCEQASKDAVRMRQFNRLLCWLVEQGWDGELEVYKDDNNNIALCFHDSFMLSRDLMYGIANGVIEL